jgi:hypothetical protein
MNFLSSLRAFNLLKKRRKKKRQEMFNGFPCICNLHPGLLNLNVPQSILVTVTISVPCNVIYYT